MRLQIKGTKEQVELIKAMASRDLSVAIKAQEALAAYITPVINTALAQAPTISNFWRTLPFSEDDNPTIPLDLYTDTDDNFVNVWSTRSEGGLATNEMTPYGEEITLHTTEINSAYSFKKKHALKSRLDVIAKSLAFVGNTILKKRDKMAATVLLSALANASVTSRIEGGDAVTRKQIIRTNTAGTFKLTDYNKIATLLKRLYMTRDGGTPMDDAGGIGLTDLIISPEISEQIRNMAFNPQNNKGSNTDIPATDAIRNAAFNSAGIPNFFGVNLVEFREMGVNSKWNILFKSLAGSTAYPATGESAGSSTTAVMASTEELIIGLDRNRDSLIRPAIVSSTDVPELDFPQTFTVYPDDSFFNRGGKMGWFGGEECGYSIIDTRAMCGMLI